MIGRFKDFTDSEGEHLALALGEYVQDRWGQTGRYITGADDDDRDHPIVQLYAEVLRAGAAPDPYQREVAERVRRLVPLPRKETA